MKKTLIVSVLLIFSQYISAQNEESSSIDGLLNDLFSLDSLEVPTAETFTMKYLYGTVSYDNKVYFSGRDYGYNQYSISPNITYIHNNLFINTGSVYYSEMEPHWDLLSLSVGYSDYLDKKSRINLTGIYSYTMYNNDTIKNSHGISSSISYRYKKFKTSLSGGYSFGENNTFHASSKTYLKMKLIQKGDFTLTLRPSVNLLMSKQTITENDSSVNSIESDVFQLINTEIKLPLEFDFDFWDFEIAYAFNFPSKIPDEESLSNNGYLSLSIGYLLGL